MAAYSFAGEIEIWAIGIDERSVLILRKLARGNTVYSLLDLDDIPVPGRHSTKASSVKTQIKLAYSNLGLEWSSHASRCIAIKEVTRSGRHGIPELLHKNIGRLKRPTYISFFEFRFLTRNYVD